MTKIKICGLFRPTDIDFVNEAGPDYAGFILNFPKSHRSLSPEAAAALRRRLAPGIQAVCVFVDQPMERVLEAARLIRPDVIQLHGGEDDGYVDELRERAKVAVWKAFKISHSWDLASAEACGADEVLLDNGYGTGRAFDWENAAGFARPFILAGGLSPENIPEAIRTLRPWAVDISSGVESGRLKDRNKILAAVASARESA